MTHITGARVQRCSVHARVPASPHCTPSRSRFGPITSTHRRQSTYRCVQSSPLSVSQHCLSSAAPRDIHSGTYYSKRATPRSMLVFKHHYSMYSIHAGETPGDASSRQLPLWLRWERLPLELRGSLLGIGHERI